MPGTDEALKAAGQRGYEAILMAIVLIACISLVGLLIRWFVNSMDKRLAESADREKRLADRVTELEKFIEQTLVKMIENVSVLMQKNTEASSRLADMLDTKPCLLERSNQELFIEKVAGRISAEIKALSHSRNLGSTFLYRHGFPTSQWCWLWHG